MLVALIFVWLGVYTLNNSCASKNAREIFNTVASIIIGLIAMVLVYGLAVGAIKL